MKRYIFFVLFILLFIFPLLNSSGSDRDLAKDLRNACQTGNYDEVERLLAIGADINLLSDYKTPLCFAIRYNHVDIVKLLIEKGADVNIPDKHGLTPLMSAAGKGNLEIVRLLLENGADIHLKNKTGRDAFMQTNGNIDIIKLFIEYGIDINESIEHGSTVLSLGFKKDRPETIQFLIDHGTKINVKNTYDGSTPLLNACQKGHLQTARILIENGGNVNDCYHYSQKKR